MYYHDPILILIYFTLIGESTGFNQGYHLLQQLLKYLFYNKINLSILNYITRKILLLYFKNKIGVWYSTKSMNLLFAHYEGINNKIAMKSGRDHNLFTIPQSFSTWKESYRSLSSSQSADETIPCMSLL